jgi:hypothetical protein
MESFCRSRRICPPTVMVEAAEVAGSAASAYLQIGRNKLHFGTSDSSHRIENAASLQLVHYAGGSGECGGENRRSASSRRSYKWALF